jgi:hypothetical protein
MRPVIDTRTSAVRTQLLVLLALAFAASAACGKTALDNPGSGPGACGNEVLDGYLFDGWECAIQGFASLPAYQSKEGFGCNLDVYLSEQIPASAIPAACSGGPFTSKCFLEATGFMKSARDDIAGYPRVSLMGSMQTVDVCTAIAKCAPMKPACEECQKRAIFVPCQVSVE